MPRRRYSKKSRLKRKWRQQKVSVGTIAKIAKKVATYEIKKKEEPKFSLNILGSPPVDSASLPTRCVITKTGLYEISPNAATGSLDSIWQQRVQHHPQTQPLLDDQGAGGTQVLSGFGTRVGDTVELKGIAVKGYLLLGKECENARIYMGFHSAEQQLNNPSAYLPRLDGMQLRRNIADTEKLNGTKVSKMFTLNHRAQDEEVKIPVNMYLPINKRVRYNLNQTPGTPMNEIWYMDKRYYFVCYSDTPNGSTVQGGIAPGIPNAQLQQTLDKFPQFYGSFRAYYRDS